MATKSVGLVNSAYTKLDTCVETAVDCQVIGTGFVRIVLAASQPLPTATNYYVLKGGQGLSRDGKSGDMWGISDTYDTMLVTVGE